MNLQIGRRDEEMFIIFVMILLIGILINGLYQLLIKGKGNYGKLEFIEDMPMHESMVLPKSGIQDSHWHIKTFHRPRRIK